MHITIFSQISIDGKLTMGAGKSSKPLFSFFNQSDITYIHKFRGAVDAIMVGKNTILTDNPFLTNRVEENKNPVRIIPTKTFDLPMDANVLTDDGRTIVVTTEQGYQEEKAQILRERGKECIVCGEDQVNFRQLFLQLEEQYGMKRVMVEGGGQLNWHIFNEDLANDIILMQLPIIIGGHDNVTLVDGDGYTELALTKQYKVVELDQKENYTLMRFVKLQANMQTEAV
ncbi:dihydrofolate reductase family protein [Marinicrinis sediminis]|uniref:Dihydrofolate reductase family protein n=1 Tax=Marinicrinis sediminis TaxID=1652465 RepID=A0ABW5R8Z6_9BACL